MAFLTEVNYVKKDMQRPFSGQLRVMFHNTAFITFRHMNYRCVLQICLPGSDEM